MVDDQGATLVRGRQQHDQRGDHARQLLRILVRTKELTGSVNLQIVQMGFQGLTFAAMTPQAKIDRKINQRRLEHLRPAAAFNLDALRRNFPGIAHLFIE